MYAPFSTYLINKALDKMLKLLGQGTFGKVVECWDYVDKKMCAVKIIRAVEKYREASKVEVRVLRDLERYDPANR